MRPSPPISFNIYGRHYCNFGVSIRALRQCVMFDLGHFQGLSELSGTSWPSAAPLQEPLGNYSSEYRLWLMSVTRDLYTAEDFTSGTSKGTSWPLLLRMSASRCRVLSLGMMFSSCIFVHASSAFCQLFVSSNSTSTTHWGGWEKVRSHTMLRGFIAGWSSASSVISDKALHAERGQSKR